MEGKAVNENKCDFNDVPWAAEYSLRMEIFLLQTAHLSAGCRAEVTAELCKF